MKRLGRTRLKHIFVFGRSAFAVLTVAFPLHLHAQQALGTTVLGLVENNPAEQGEAPGTGLRVAFFWNGKSWTAAMSEPTGQSEINHCPIKGIETRQQWQVLNGGQAIGSVTTKGWLNSQFYSLNGLLRITSHAPIIGEASALFGGWMGKARYRPLLAVLGSPTVKATTWASTSVRPGDLKEIWPSFRKAVPTVPRCNGNGEWITPQPATVQEDVEVTHAISDGHGARLLCAGLREDRLGTCDGIGDRSLSDFWFFVSNSDRVTPLAVPVGDDSISLTPLEFVNLNGDADAVFLYSGYNRDGYILYCNKFRESVVFSWSYH